MRYTHIKVDFINMISFPSKHELLWRQTAALHLTFLSAAKTFAFLGNSNSVDFLDSEATSKKILLKPQNISLLYKLSRYYVGMPYLQFNMVIKCIVMKLTVESSDSRKR
jgi:hypothetical protein